MRIGILGATGPAGRGSRRGSRASVTRCCSARGRSRRPCARRRAREGVGRPRRGPAHRVRQRVGVRRAGRDPRGARRLGDPDGAGARRAAARQDRRLDGEQPREARQRVQRGAPAARFGGGRDPGAAVALARQHRVPPRARGRVRRRSTTRWRATSSCSATRTTRKATVMEITSSIPNLRPLDGGSLRNAVGMETFAAVLLDGQHPAQDAGEPAPHTSV